MSIKETLESLSDINLFVEPQEMIVFTDEPKIPGYLTFANETCSAKYNTNDVFGQGYDPNRKLAKIKSMGEFLERLCLYNPQLELLSYGKFKNNGYQIDPNDFYCYSEEQENIDSVKSKISGESYRWLECYDYFKDRNVMIPAHLIFLFGFENEFSVRNESITTGAALGPVSHNDIENNITFQKCLLETIERDACISSYLTKRNLPRIVEVPKDIENILEYLKRYELESYVFDATTDLGVPTVLTATIDKSGIGPAVNIGSRSEFNYKDAILYSILESIHSRAHIRIMKDVEFPDKFPNEEEVTSLKNRIYYWYPTQRINDLSFWLNNSSTIEYKKLIKNKKTPKKILDIIKDKDFNIYVADITLPEIKEGGFQVLKVVIPELHSLYLDERAKSLYSVHFGAIPNDKELKPHPMT